MVDCLVGGGCWWARVGVGVGIEITTDGWLGEKKERKKEKVERVKNENEEGNEKEENNGR